MKSRAWYALSLVPVLIAVMFALARYERLVEHIAGMQRVVIPGGQTLALAAGEVLLYGESESEIAGTHRSNPAFTFQTACTLDDEATGHAIALDTVALGYRKYNLGGYRGRSMYRGTLAAAGRFSLRCDGDGTGPAVVAIGAPLPLLGIAELLVVVVLGAVASLVVFGVVQGRRRRAGGTSRA